MTQTNTTANDKRVGDTGQGRVCLPYGRSLYDCECSQRWEDEGGALLPPKEDAAH